MINFAHRNQGIIPRYNLIQYNYGKENKFS